jgi:polysaccharide biosynthesis/export protein
MRTLFPYRATVVLFASLGGLTTFCVAQAPDGAPKELIQYIVDAKRRGVAESKIRQQARTIGWPAALVDKALAENGAGGSKPNPAPATPVAEDSALPAPDAEVLKPGPPPSVPAAEESTQLSVRSAAPAPASPRTAVESAGAPDPRRRPDDYLIGAGDALQVNVWNEKELSVPTVVVRPDGKITVPLIKDVAVAGLTPSQAEKLISEGLSQYVTDANVTVVVATINSKKVYVVGAVRKEGTLPYTYGMNVMQALSEAGGLTEYAKRKKIYILRAENGRDYRLDFNYDEAVRGRRMEQNVLLLPGDTVVIPQ